jgi:hypothetical protein
MPWVYAWLRQLVTRGQEARLFPIRQQPRLGNACGAGCHAACLAGLSPRSSASGLCRVRNTSQYLSAPNSQRGQLPEWGPSWLRRHMPNCLIEFQHSQGIDIIPSTSCSSILFIKQYSSSRIQCVFRKVPAWQQQMHPENNAASICTHRIFPGSAMSTFRSGILLTLRHTLHIILLPALHRMDSRLLTKTRFHLKTAMNEKKSKGLTFQSTGTHVVPWLPMNATLPPPTLSTPLFCFHEDTRVKYSS